MDPVLMGNCSQASPGPEGSGAMAPSSPSCVSALLPSGEPLCTYKTTWLGFLGRIILTAQVVPDKRLLISK